MKKYYRISARITEETRKKLVEISEKKGVTITDVLVEMINNKFQETKNEEK